MYDLILALCTPYRIKTNLHVGVSIYIYKEDKHTVCGFLIKHEVFVYVLSVCIIRPNKKNYNLYRIVYIELIECNEHDDGTNAPSLLKN